MVGEKQAVSTSVRSSSAVGRRQSLAPAKLSALAALSAALQFCVDRVPLAQLAPDKPCGHCFQISPVSRSVTTRWPAIGSAMV